MVDLGTAAQRIETSGGSATSVAKTRAETVVVRGTPPIEVESVDRVAGDVVVVVGAVSRVRLSWTP
jgi:hypothetical protein